MFCAQVAQLVEQGTENPCVGGSIPPLGTTLFNYFFIKYNSKKIFINFKMKDINLIYLDEKS